MDRTLTELNSAFDSLLLRVNQLDGIGLSKTAEATVSKIQRDLAGLKETVNQAVLALDSRLNDIETEVQGLTILLQSHLSSTT